MIYKENKKFNLLQKRNACSIKIFTAVIVAESL